MTQKKNKERGQKSISYMALEFLYKQGPMTYVSLTELIREQPKCSKYTTKSVHTKLLDMESRGLVTRDDKGVWSLMKGVTPQILITGELEMTTERLLDEQHEPGEETPEEEESVSEEEEKTPEGEEPAAAGKPGRRSNTQADAGPKVPAKSAGIPLDQRDLFIKHMSDIGVGPKEAIPTIADLFFAGNINDLSWLNQVLKRNAAGYVSPYQRELIVGFWSKTRGLPYDEEEPDWTDYSKPGARAAKVKADAKEEKPSSALDAGQGWRVGKDRQGDWVALMGGDLTYEEALNRAERRAAIAAYSQGGEDEEGELSQGGDQAAPKGKGKGGGHSFVETMMLRIMDNLLDGGGKKDSAADAKVEALEARLAAMSEDRMEERFEHLEGLVAQAASRDPWDEYTRFQQQATRFGFAPNVVTDNSPAVQLIKDSTDKLDKNVGRLMGIIERTALKSEEFAPEQTRTAGQREQKAGELLHVAEGRDKSRQLRKEVFNT